MTGMTAARLPSLRSGRSVRCLCGVLLFAYLLTTRAASCPKNQDNDCLPLPAGDYLFDFYQQTNPGNTTLVLQFRSLLYLEETMPNVITGLGAGVFSHNAPVPKPMLMIPAPTQVVGTRDPDSCVIATTFFGSDPPFNDILPFRYDGERLYAEYWTMVDMQITRTVPSIAIGTRLPDE